MRIEIIYAVLTLFSQTAFSQRADTDIETLKSLNKNWINSYPTKDTTTLNKILADDFVLINHKGTKLTKKDIINNIHKQETVSAKIDSVDVKLLAEDVGVMTAYTTFVLKSDGQEMAGQNCYQDIYVRRNGKWVAARLMSRFCV